MGGAQSWQGWGGAQPWGPAISSPQRGGGESGVSEHRPVGAPLHITGQCGHFPSVKSSRPSALGTGQKSDVQGRELTHAGLALGQRRASSLPARLPTSWGPGGLGLGGGRPQPAPPTPRVVRRRADLPPAAGVLGLIRGVVTGLALTPGLPAPQTAVRVSYSPAIGSPALGKGGRKEGSAPTGGRATPAGAHR